MLCKEQHMPFTLSHPVAVWPLRKLCGQSIPLAALVIGAMVPDIAYFVALRPTGHLGHTPWGVCVQGLPSGLVIYALWVWVVRRPWRETFPEWIVARWEPERSPAGMVARLVRVSLGVVMGALTHIVWDSFTHKTGLVVEHMSMLTQMYGGVEVYRWLQYGGGVVGLVGVCLWMGLWLLRSPASARTGSAKRHGKWGAWAWCVLSSLGMACVALRGLDSSSLHVKIVRAVIGACTGFGMGMVVYAVAWHVVRRLKGGTEPAHHS
jgi:hypothetical protein